MQPIILEVDVFQRANAQRNARLLREMQCVCQINRRRLGVKPFQGLERRVFNQSRSMAGTL